MKILLTGSTGFLGKNLLPFLIKKKHKVLILIRNKKNIKINSNQKVIFSKLENININNLKKIKNFKPEILINLAWHGIPEFSYRNSIKNLQDQTIFINKIFDLNIIKKIINIGSCWEYPQNLGKCSESDKTSPTKYFPWSKNALMNFIQFKCRERKINFVWFRVFYMYGQYQRKGSVIPTIIDSLRNLKKPNLSSPNNLNDYVHVNDVCDAIIRTIDKKATNGIFNLGSGKLISVFDIYMKILRLMNLSKIPKFRIKIKKINDNKSNFACLKRTKKQLKWHPQINLDVALKSLVKLK
jgi:nucleoside-diphosphate-sugar epimerase